MNVSNPQQVRDAVVEVFKEGGRRFERVFILEHLSGPTGPTSLAVETGAARRSVRTITATFGQVVRLAAFFGLGLPYRFIHEYGGTIRPKTAKFLAIPLPGLGAKNALGPRNFPGKLVCIRTRFGNLILAEILGKTATGRQKTRTYKTGAKWTNKATGEVEEGTAKSQIRPIFVLKDSVTLPPRLNFRKTFKDEGRTTLAQARSKIRDIVLSTKKT
jgi:hypothetical protein